MRTSLLLFVLALPTFPASVIAAPPAQAEPAQGYKLDRGPFAVASFDLTLHDDARDKDLEVTVRFPKVAAADSSTFPLVVFSHGAGGSRDAFPDLTAHWASHGYVVVLPTHSDSIALRRRNGENMRELAKNPSTLLKDVKPMERVADVKFILDSLAKIEDHDELLRFSTTDPLTHKVVAHGRIDREKIAMSGHSAGALTTQMIVGVKVRGSRSMEQGKAAGAGDLLTARSVGDPRVKAGIIISGGGLNNRMMTEESWNELSVPILTITGSNDVAAIGNETPETRRHSFEYSRGREKGGPPAYLLWIEGATHSSYGGKAGRRLGDKGSSDGLDLDMTVKATTATTQAFLDAFIRVDAAAKAYLEDPARTEALTDGRAELKNK
ncbi:MAG TPA: hypothetical protein VHN77_15490 [Phycisphaerales bacterium]|nr:hypothetical protein [Phycisphaerales bacterium]